MDVNTTETEALRLALAYRHGFTPAPAASLRAGATAPMTRTVDGDMMDAATWEAWGGRGPGDPPMMILVHRWPTVVEVVTYYVAHRGDLRVNAYLPGELPAGWPDWLAIVGLS